MAMSTPTIDWEEVAVMSVFMGIVIADIYILFFAR